MPQLNKKEKVFCRKYLETGNLYKASEYAQLSKDPYELLKREDIKNEIKKLGDALNTTAEYLAKAALIRLAVGSVYDAVNLAYTDKADTDNISGRDLFMVSEIKRKGEATEIKFFDRFKAIRYLMEGSDRSESSVPFYDALIAGAEKLNES